MVTLLREALRASTATAPVRPRRAPFDSSRAAIGCLIDWRRDVDDAAEAPLHHAVDGGVDQRDRA